MNLKLLRSPSNSTCTPGVLYVEDYFQCFMLEDVERLVKIPGQTAIPRGRYEVRWTFSQRFQRETPQLIDVPNFTGIRIHPGNTDKDTEGCPLPGRLWLPEANKVLESTLAYDALVEKLHQGWSSGKIFIDIDGLRPLT